METMSPSTALERELDQALFDAPSRHTPDRIEIEIHTDPRSLTQLTTLSMLLHRDGVAVWHQASDGGGDIDVAALEIDRSALPQDSVLQAFGPTDLPAGFDMFEVGDSLAIPGFPLGFFDTAHHHPHDADGFEPLGPRQSEVARGPRSAMKRA